MENIFKIRESGVCKKADVDAGTAFTYYEIEAGKDIWNHGLPVNYIFFVLGGAIEISCNEFENRRFQSNEMVFLLRSSSVYVKALKNTKLYVMYFDIFLSSCDRQLFKAYLPDVEKVSYDFAPVPIPQSVLIFLKQTIYFQEQKVDCMHFNNIKHREFFILLRSFCSREEIVMFLSPLISHSSGFRNKVLEKYTQLETGRVTDLANLSGFGRKNFDKRFQEEFGTSPARWLMQEKAKRLRLFLMEPGVTISDAMDKFHFNSPGYFNRFCHQHFKAPPGMIIKEARKLNKKVKKVKAD